MQNIQRHSNYSTVLLIVLRERIENLPHKGLVLDALNISKEILDNILNGDKEMSAYQLLILINKFNWFDITNVVSNLIYVFEINGFYFQDGNLNKREDELLKLYKEFYTNLEFVQELKLRNVYGLIEHQTSSFVHYCINDKFRKFFNEENIQEFVSWNVYR